jgi:predicted HTH transcriptional regulator
LGVFGAGHKFDLRNGNKAFIIKIDDDRLNAMATDDYLLLASLFAKNGQERINRADFEHLAELEILRFTEFGIELVNSETTMPIDYQSTATVDWQSIGSTDRKRQIVAFMAENGKTTTSQLAKFTGLTQGRIRTILQELVADGVVVKDRDFRYASYTSNAQELDK